jgi:simple sugar transport system permease protein
MTTTQSVPVKTATPSTPAAGPRIQNAVIKYGFIFVTVTLFTYFALSEPSFRDSASVHDSR